MAIEWYQLEVVEVYQVKKSVWGALNGATWVQSDIRDAVVDFTTEWSAKTELPADQLIAWIGI